MKRCVLPIVCLFVVSAQATVWDGLGRIGRGVGEIAGGAVDVVKSPFVDDEKKVEAKPAQNQQSAMDQKQHGQKKAVMKEGTEADNPKQNGMNRQNPHHEMPAQNKNMESKNMHANNNNMMQNNKES